MPRLAPVTRTVQFAILAGVTLGLPVADDMDMFFVPRPAALGGVWMRSQGQTPARA
jgi:hypothetical protein